MAEQVTIYADRLDPEKVPVPPGGAVEWTNKSGDEATLKLPSIFKKKGKETIPNNGSSGEFEVKDKEPKKGYGYQVLGGKDLVPRNGTIDVT